MKVARQNIYQLASKSPKTTGNLPKFNEDMYYISKDDLYCIPTAEVPLTNIHTDEVFMPKNKLTWSSWNFLNNSKSDDFSLTYWMNRLQNITSKKNYFVTINPNRIPNNIIDQTTFEHPVFTLETIKAQKDLYKIQGNKNTFYC